MNETHKALAGTAESTEAASRAWALRDYQQAAVDATLQHFRRSDQAACLVLPTGAGKSLIIAELARLARGKILVLAHVKELCEQNFDKFQRSGLPAGLFSAGLGEKHSEFPVTFATVQSVARNLDQFQQAHSLLIIDECHRLSGAKDSQYGQVISHLKRTQPHLKVLGLTATPYRLGLGWIYRLHHSGRVRTDESRPFECCVYEVSLRRLISQGYLTEPQLVDAPIAQYDFSSLTPSKEGHYPAKECNELLVRHRRVTQSIVEQIVKVAAERQGVMIFAATVEHAKEVMSYLPNGAGVLVLGETVSADRDKAIASFKAKKIKYLVNVSVLTTGFDAPHVDLIAILRPSESVSLLQQMVGRGLRLSEGKKDCLIVDYAGSGLNLFHPEVGEPKPRGNSVPVEVLCPQCDFANTFWGVLDAEGECLEHYGRRCQALVREPVDTGSLDRRKIRSRQCSYRFRFKECEKCGAQCDIAARRCPRCSSALTDPDDQLKRALGLKDARVLRVAGLSFVAQGSVLIVTYHDEEGSELRERFDFQHAGQRAVFQRLFSRTLAGHAPRKWQQSSEVATSGHIIVAPQFVIARREKKRFWRIATRIFDYQGRYRTANRL